MGSSESQFERFHLNGPSWKFNVIDGRKRTIIIKSGNSTRASIGRDET